MFISSSKFQAPKNGGWEFSNVTRRELGSCLLARRCAVPARVLRPSDKCQHSRAMLKLVQESGKRLSALFGRRSRRLSARRSTGFAMRRPRPTRRPQIWWGTRARQPTVGRNGVYGGRARALYSPSISLCGGQVTFLHDQMTYAGSTPACRRRAESSARGSKSKRQIWSSS